MDGKSADTVFRNGLSVLRSTYAIQGLTYPSKMAFFTARLEMAHKKRDMVKEVFMQEAVNERNRKAVWIAGTYERMGF